MKSLFLVALGIVACSSSSADPAPTNDDASADAAPTIESGGACLLSGANCADPNTTPCCSQACVIGPLGEFTCR